MSTSVLLGWFGVGPQELLIFLVIALLLFGHRLPSVMRSLGRGVVEFKKGVQGIEDDIESATSEPDRKPKVEE
jgi:sec-independent protein translocase protein TatA